MLRGIFLRRGCGLDVLIQFKSWHVGLSTNYSQLEGTTNQTWCECYQNVHQGQKVLSEIGWGGGRCD